MSDIKVKVRKVDSVVSHPNADRLEIVNVLGWRCCVPKGEIKEGDLVVYVPPDVCLPEELANEWGVKAYLGKGNRVRACNLRGVTSYGIVMPTKVIEKYDVDKEKISETLGITKYIPFSERETKIGGDKVKQKRKMKFSFNRLKNFFHYAELSIFEKIRQMIKNPTNPFGYLTDTDFPSYTDIENIKNFNNVIPKGTHVFVQEKVDGTNFRAGWVNGNWYVGSHNNNLAPDGKNLYWKMAEKYSLKEVLKEYYNGIKEDVIVYGEIYGKGIPNSGILKYENEPALAFFDAKIKNEFLSPIGLVKFFNSARLPLAPAIWWNKEYDLEELLKLCENTLPRIINIQNILEGVVIRPMNPLFENLYKKRKIFKMISDKYTFKKEKMEG